MLVAMTGATGHIGANLTRALLERGDTLRVLVREDTRAIDGLDLEHVKGDVRDPVSLACLFQGAEVVYHLAGHITVERREIPLVREVNVGGTRNVVAACLASDVRRLVHFSSIHAFADHPLDEPIDETRRLVEDGEYLPYNRSKAAGWREVLAGVEKGLDAVAVNPTGVLGPHDYKPSLMGETVEQLATGRFPALIGAGYNFVDVRDVIQGAMAAETKGRKGETYLLPGNRVEFPDLARAVHEVTSTPPPRFVSPMWMARIGAPFVTLFSRITGGRPRYTSGSLEVLRGNKVILHDKATRELGYQPRPLLDTIRDTVDWLREVGRIP